MFIACDRLNIVVTTLPLARTIFCEKQKKEADLTITSFLGGTFSLNKMELHIIILYFRSRSIRSVVINSSLTIPIYNNSDSGPGSGCQCDSGESRSQQGHWSDVFSILSHQRSNIQEIMETTDTHTFVDIHYDS